ncbi:MAG: hypothetical protein R6W73_09050 [Candidatus Saliniplasma sp.]
MEEVLTKDRLMMLLNEAEKKGIDRFTITEPYTDTQLIEVIPKDGSYNVILSGKDKFGPYPSEEDYWDREDIPDFYDYKECLISSGLVEFDNWLEFKEWVKYLYKSEVDPTLASTSVFMSIDTNLAYFRLFSRRFPLEYEEGTVIRAEDFDYLLSSIVENEIDHKIKDKYDNSDLKMMGMYTKIGDIRFNFRNRGKLSTRRAKFATEELNYLRGKLNAARIKGTPSKTDSEKNDIRIVESLEKFSWDRNIVVALVSTDRNMGNHAENSEIPYFILEMPKSIPRENLVESDIVLNLMHDLALTFGAVKIPELKTTLFGIWGGKRDEDYWNESVKAWINPGSELKDHIKKDIDIIESLEGPV